MRRRQAVLPERRSFPPLRDGRTVSRTRASLVPFLGLRFEVWITFGIVAGGQCHRPENKPLGLCTSRCPPKLGVEAGKGVCFARDGRAPRQRLMRTRGQRLGPIVRCYYAPSEAARVPPGRRRTRQRAVFPPHTAPAGRRSASLCASGACGARIAPRFGCAGRGVHVASRGCLSAVRSDATRAVPGFYSAQRGHTKRLSEKALL